MLRIAGIQMNGSSDKARNLEKAQLLAEIAAESGAKMICFQELFTTHWFPMDINPDHFQLAEEIPGPATEAMQLMARKSRPSSFCLFLRRTREGFISTRP